MSKKAPKLTLVVTLCLSVVCAISVTLGQGGRAKLFAPGHSLPPGAQPPQRQRYDYKLAQSEAAKKAAEETSQPAEGGPTESVSDASSVLDAARERLRSYKGLKAAIVESVNIGSKPFKATGVYMQGTGDRVRVEFQFGKGEPIKGAMKQVCDGQILWTRFDVGGESYITRQDIQQIREALQGSPRIPDGKIAADIGYGGLKGLLASLQETMDFSAPRKEVHVVKQDGKDANADMIVLRGKWTEAMRKVLLGPDAPEDAFLPSYMPDLAWVYLDAKNLFPYRIMYLKKLPNQDKAHALVTLDITPDWSLVPTNEDFEYIPPDEIIPNDITLDVIKGLKSRSKPEKESADKKG